MFKFLLVLLLFPTAALAAPSEFSNVWVDVTLASQHLGAKGVNQFNPGIGVETKHFAIGEYDNSLNRTSFYGGYKLETQGRGADVAKITHWCRMPALPV